MNSVLSAFESSTLGRILPKTLFRPSPLIKRVARVLCIKLLVPLGAVGMVSRMLVYVVGVFLMFRWVGAVCNV